MVRILSTLIAADAGEARVAGFDVRTQPDGVRRSIGVTGQFSAIDGLLTGRENLRLMADLAHLAAREASPGWTSCWRGSTWRRRRPARGDVLRRHAATARPRHDAGEPTAADLPRRADDRARPAQPPRLWQIVRELLAEGVTVFLTTQYLEEADQLAHTVGLLDNGRLVATGTPAELKAQAGGDTLDDVFLALTGHAATTDNDQEETETSR